MSLTVAAIRLDNDKMDAIHGGLAECRTLSECLAVDFSILARTLDGLEERDFRDISSWSKLGITRRMRAMAELLRNRLGDDMAASLASHPSDTVRGWAAYMIGGRAGVSLPEILDAVRPLADDSHFGVREWAWLAIRPRLAQDLDEALAQLAPWTEAASEYIRRFACEATRPRGVWSSHLPQLKNAPWLGTPILDPLRADKSTYVQDSVANWLNDAAKSQPAWVGDLCRTWQAASPSPATARICQRALRSIKRA